MKGQRIYRLLLHVYPRRFRRRFEGRLLEAFRLQRGDGEYGGVGGGLRFWRDVLADLTRSVVRLRAEQITDWLSDPGRTVRSARSSNGGSMWLATTWSDVRYALRVLRREPMFAAASLATIALGVAASTAVFSVVDAAMFRPLPFAEPDRLVFIAETHPEQAGGGAAAPETYRDWLTSTTSLDGLAAWAYNSRVHQGADGAEVLTVADASPTLFGLLGREAMVGRTFTAADGEAGELLAVLSEGFWRSRFGGDVGVIGRSIELDGKPYTVVGVVASDFAIPAADVPLWTLESWADDTGRGGRYLGVIGRLAAGRTADHAAADLNAIAERLAASFPNTNAGWAVSVVPLRDRIVGAAAAPMRLIGLSVALLLLVACFNVAGLILARASARGREIAVRQALGGGWRITRLLVTESMVLALLGGMAGLVMATSLIQALVASPPVDIPLLENVHINARSLMFAAGTMVVTAFVFALLPALHVARATTADSLRTSAGGGPARATGLARARSALVVGEIAIAVILVIGAALLLRSMVALNAVRPGFETADRVAARVFLDGATYGNPADRTAWIRRVETGLSASPGVLAAGSINSLPMDPVSVNFDLPYLAEGLPPAPASELPQAQFRVVSGDLFPALGTRVVRGRAFRPSDDENAARVAMINERLASEAFGAADPVGRRVTIMWGPGAAYEVIGVVEDIRHEGLTGDAAAQVFVHFPQFSLPFGSTNLVVHVNGNATGFVRDMERVILAADPGQPAHSVLPLRTLVAESVARERFATTLLTGLAVLSLVLAAIGLYGLISYLVRLRSRELAIRMALGARHSTALALVMRHGVGLTVAGALIGVLGAAATARVVESLLFQVSPLDPLTYLVVPLGLLGVAILATFKPAWTAATIDPGSSLHEE